MTTEQAIRAAFQESWERDVAIDFADAPIKAAGTVDDVFEVRDFRESEVAALDALLADAREEMRADYDAVIERYRESLEEVAVRFAREHPDAPRSAADETDAAR
jgi:hypothetical protein